MVAFRLIRPLRRFRRGGFVFLLFTLATLAGCFFLGKGRVVQVADGDTLTVLTEGGKLVRVRLYGVDCPESRQKGGKAATDFTRDLALFQEVTLVDVDTDRYDRDVALVRLANGRTLNEELVRAGHAWVYRRYCTQPICATWLDLERQARGQKLGLWRDKSPRPPWQWWRENPR